MTDIFSSQVLTEKLTNLNNSQQSIETLSRWCILHRKKAKQIVETWDTMFNNFPKEKRVPLMYLANDILQNSRRRGSEFVNEFWKVLPGALKSIYESGDDREKRVMMRLVNIWEERKVFGSRGRTLKDEMLGKGPPVSVENNGKSSNAIKIMKKDAHSIRIKLAIGCLPERIISAFQLVHDEQSNEDNVLTKCKSAVDQLGNLEKDIDIASTQGLQYTSPSVSEFLEQEYILNQCIGQMETLEATRASLVSCLKEALLEQESRWSDIRLQLQVAKAEADHMTSLKQKLNSVPAVSSSVIPAMTLEMKAVSDASLPNQVVNMVMQFPAQLATFPNRSNNSTSDSSSKNQGGNSMMLPSTQSTGFANSTTSAEDQNKKTAAAVAAKLAAMTSSAQVLTSVLSSFVAEEAASMTGGNKFGSLAGSSPTYPPDKRPKLEKPMLISDMSNVPVVQMLPNQSSAMSLGASISPGPPVIPGQPPVNMAQSIFPPLPPLPSSLAQLPTYNAPSAGGVAGAGSYSFPGSSLPLPPPASLLVGLTRSVSQSVSPMQQQGTLQQSQHMQQQQHILPPALQLPPPPQLQKSNTACFFPNSGMPFYGLPPPAGTGPPQAHQR